jgi:hypothetical protein
VIGEDEAGQGAVGQFLRPVRGQVVDVEEAFRIPADHSGEVALELCEQPVQAAFKLLLLSLGEVEARQAAIGSDSMAHSHRHDGNLRGRPRDRQHWPIAGGCERCQPGACSREGKTRPATPVCGRRTPWCTATSQLNTLLVPQIADIVCGCSRRQ